MTAAPARTMPGTIYRPDDGPLRLLGPAETLSFLDSRSVTLPRALTPLEAWNAMMATPLPLISQAFALRDAISARFGVRRIGGFSGRKRDRVAVGDRLDFFLVEDVAPEALTLTERDRHLDVMTCISVQGTRLTVTSSVRTHNLFGRAYMLVVGPAHKVIVRSMLARLDRTQRAAD